ncbi:MAG: alcohol dehydrogenase catalytic domain-containing protein [Firmicutes bacterium]|nr:alcohol dehydrogenase catalytic domain-containing protein [Bacillota bacterium]
MNALVLKEPFSLMGEDRPLPQPRPGEMIVQVAFCGVCRTDRKAYRQGQRDLKLPRVLGHEFSGRIVAAGLGLPRDTLGRKVSVHPGIFCGACAACRSGNDQLCESMRILGFHLDGGFAKYVRIPKQGVERGVVRILEDGFDLRYAAMAEPLGCAVHMANLLPLEDISSVLITGGGVMGMMTAKILRQLPRKILLTEPLANKRKLLQGMGLPAVSPENLREGMAKLGLAAFDCAINCSPHSLCLAQCLQTVRKGGYFGFFSGLTDFTGMEKDVVNEIHYKELTVKGAYGCGSRDTLQALALIQNGLELSDIPVRRIALSDCETVLRCEETEDSILTMIDMEVDDYAGM